MPKESLQQKTPKRKKSTTHQRSNHENPRRQPIPQPTKPNISINPRHGLHSAFSRLPITIQLTNHHIGWVRYDGTPDTGYVTTQEGDAGLLKAVIGGFGLSETSVDCRDGGFKGCEFYHCVGDLAGPEGVETFVETVVFMLACQSSNRSPRIMR